MALYEWEVMILILKQHDLKNDDTSLFPVPSLHSSFRICQNHQRAFFFYYFLIISYTVLLHSSSAQLCNISQYMQIFQFKVGTVV